VSIPTTVSGSIFRWPGRSGILPSPGAGESKARLRLAARTQCVSCYRGAAPSERLSLTAQGHTRYALKTPYRDGTTHVIFEPLDFLARLAAWAQRLKRVFGIEIESCQHCGGAVKIIASIEDPQVIGRILEHLGLDGSDAHGRQLPPARAPPIGSIGLFD
jgi:hypothetical protein